MVDEILGRLPKNVVTTLPIAYRGLFIDEFIVLTLPALIVLLIGAARRLPAYRPAVVGPPCVDEISPSSETDLQRAGADGQQR